MKSHENLIEVPKAENRLRNGTRPKSQTKNLLVTLMLVFGCATPAIAQIHKEMDQSELFLLIGFVAFGLLFGLLIILYVYKKNEEKLKRFRPVLDGIFKERGFSAADIIWTNCRYEEKDCKPVNNIVIGFNNDVISFFGGGIEGMLRFFTKDERVVFCYYDEEFLSKRILQKGYEYDFFLYDSKTLNCLFPKKSGFRHLFDIPINKIESVEGRRIGKEIEFNIECKDDSLIKLSSCCFNVGMKIEITKSLINVFEKLSYKGTISKARISNANHEICNFIKEDGILKIKNQIGMIGTAVDMGVSIIGRAVVSGIKTWSNDR